MPGIDITWAGGEHNFYLPIAHLRALQGACDAGPLFILKRLREGTWLVDDVTQTIRLGLEGGGLDKKEAKRLVSLHCDGSLAISVITAQVALMAALYGNDDDDPVGEAPGETPATASPISPAVKFASPGTTEPALSSDSPPPTSTE